MKSTRAAASIGARAAPPVPRRDEALERLRREAHARVEAALVAPPRPGAFALTVPAPVGPPSQILRALPDAPAFCFAPEGGSVMVALGEAFSSTTSAGRGDLEAAREALAELFGGLEHRVEGGAPAVVPRALLGLSFEPSGGASELWAELGHGRLMLPRWTHWTVGDRGALTLALAPGEQADLAAISAELDALFDALGTDELPAELPRVIEVSHSPEVEWAALVERIQIELRRGRASKIVAARRTRVRGEAPFDPAAVYDRIGEAPEGATRFFVRRGGTTFLGCTPERLFVTRGRHLETEALAGSINARADDGAARLVASEKDRDEHARVVEHLVERLGPLSVRIEAAPSPRVRRLPTVLHLRTPIEADLSPGVDALTVLEALHPTPAVGGAPVDVAREFIASHEPDRGWYASPLGFVDAAGDAEVFVALRCVLIRGAEAHLFAGAGIVSASEAGPEWEETALKMRPMLRALGVSEE